MFFRKLFGLFFLGLIIFGLLGLIGRGPGRYDAAYRQGFIDGQQSVVTGDKAASESAEEAAGGPSGTQIYYRDQSFFFPAPGAMLFLVPLAAFAFLFMRKGRRHHHRHWGGYHNGGYWGGPCGRHGKWQDGPKEKSPDDIDDGSDETIRYA
jgi:hypothetical protein